jgi:hypothetical protein
MDHGTFTTGVHGFNPLDGPAPFAVMLTGTLEQILAWGELHADPLQFGEFL